MIKTKIKKDKWIKLICGASNEDIVAIEDLCAIYTAAGVDYIDVAAEESIVRAAKKGIEWAQKSFKALGPHSPQKTSFITTFKWSKYCNTFVSF